MAGFQLEIVTPTKVIDCGSVDYLRASGLDGLFGVEPHHARAMIALEAGETKVQSGSKTTFYATGPGFADIQGGSVQLLVETAEGASDIDAARAKSAAQRAKERLTGSHADVDVARAQQALKRAAARLHVAGRK